MPPTNPDAQTLRAGVRGSEVMIEAAGPFFLSTGEARTFALELWRLCREADIRAAEERCEGR